MTTRTCGPCTACCTTAPVLPLGKPANVPCTHLRTPPECGCATYDTRPGCCSLYECEWRRGAWGAEQDRPDLSGYVLEAGRDGFDRMAIAWLCPSPGWSENHAQFKAVVEVLRQMEVVVFTPTTLHASPVEREWLKTIEMRFADGTTARLEQRTGGDS